MADDDTPVARIVQAGDPVLRTVARPLTMSDIGTTAFRDLVAMMVRTMRAAPGVGLAAPQIGVSTQVIVVEDPEELMGRFDEQMRATTERAPLPLTVIVNPTLTLAEGPRATFLEGCLSVTGYMALVARALDVTVTGIDATGPEAVARRWHLRGWPARILQHEVDHLLGTLYIDRMHARSFCGPDEAHRWAGRSTAEIAAALGVDGASD